MKGKATSIGQARCCSHENHNHTKFFVRLPHKMKGSLTKTIPYWHVDAFATKAFRGNQAAVMVLEKWLPDQVLQAIAAENMFAETAFLVRNSTHEADWELRWFTPEVEVALCGHATLASGHILLSQAQSPENRITFRTRKAGLLEVIRTAEGYGLKLPTTQVTRTDNHELMQALGVRGEVFESSSGIEGNAIVLLESESALRAVKPDFTKLAVIDLMVICTAPGDKTDIVSRVFVSAWGVDEDSVTGSAHAVLAPFWAERLDRKTFTAHQASTRGGDLSLRAEEDYVWLFGNCITVVSGQFYL